MKKFIFAVHNHQPVGNFDHVIKEAFEKSYKPFAELIFRLEYPKVCFHFSGIVYEWIEKNFPQYLDMISAMAKRDQIELLTGGYYEPILSVIPQRDAVEQVKKLNDYIFRRFGVVPRGIWIAERVYSPNIINVLTKCGIEYIIVDDTHLMTCGISDSDIKEILITENNGDVVNVFSIDHNLRYLIPYKPPNQSIDYIENSQGSIFVMADDGEKFGLWPESYKLVYEDGWLYNFFESIKNSKLEMKTFSQCLDEHKSRKKLVYMPNTSYFEMTQWSIDPDTSIKLDEFKEKVGAQNKRFVKGGIFENFFTKYPASNMIHRRVFDLSTKLEKNYNLKAADFLYKAECNCGWWHGVFGGIYLPHIRHTIYENLLNCQRLIYIPSSIPSVDICDFDLDGKNEITLETNNNYLIFSPSYGGSIVEFSSKRKAVNYSSVMSRVKESYHMKEIRDINGRVINSIDREICYDWHERRMLLDHFVTPQTSLESFSKASYPEQGDFIPQEYEYSISVFNGGAEIRLYRRGTVWYDDFPFSVMVDKFVKVSNEDGFDADYRIRNLSNRSNRFVFICELVFGFSSKSVADTRDVDGITEYIFNDEVRGIVKLNFSKPTRLWIFPIMTSSSSEAGIEKTYQGSVVGCVFDEYINQGELATFSFSLRVL